MNPDAERLRQAILRLDTFGESQGETAWLYDNADAVAELVDAAMHVSWYETADNPNAYPLNSEDVFPAGNGTTRNKAADSLRRLAQAVVNFKHSETEPPEHYHLQQPGGARP